eukprot:c18452_g1_i2.p1 GENE.c18452_g1_i2~~c18452_g1_i2.p1  ORF type:complete len:102 (-),score=15.49 c18452_g1_i2:383-688(-)
MNGSATAKILSNKNPEAQKTDSRLTSAIHKILPKLPLAFNPVSRLQQKIPTQSTSGQFRLLVRPIKFEVKIGTRFVILNLKIRAIAPCGVRLCSVQKRKIM